MGKKLKISLVVFACVSFLHIAVFADNSDMLGNLGETTNGISSININEDYASAGQIIDGLYSGSKLKTKKESTPVYLVTTLKDRTYMEKSICNAEPKKINSGVSNVPNLKSETSSDSNDNEFPVGAGVLATGIIGLAFLKKKDGYFSNYGDDLDTVIDAAHHPVDTANDLWNYVTHTNQGTDPYPSNSGPAAPPSINEVENDAAVTPHNCYPSGHCTQ